MAEKTIDSWHNKAVALSQILFFGAREKHFLSAFSEVKRLVSLSPVSVACSGGADSICALLLVWEKFPELRDYLIVLHYDHAVRPESATDAEFVENICNEIGVPFRSERREIPRSSGWGKHISEALLRKFRLDFFSREMQASGSKVLVQGHQRDDVAESILMRLTRGSGTEGLSSPRQISRQPDGRLFFRPLLDFSKKEIIEALKKANIPWREDSTNAGVDFFRNRVRNIVLPVLKKCAPFENFARSRMLAEEDSDALDFFSRCFFNDAVKLKKDIARYQLFRGNEKSRAFPAIVRRVLWHIFTEEKIKIHASAAGIDALVSAICSGTPLKTCLGKTKIFWDGVETLIFCEKKLAETLDAPHLSLEFAFPRLEQSCDAAIKIFSEKLSCGNVAEAEIVPLSAHLFEQIFSGKISSKNEVFLSLKNWRGEKIFLRETKKGEKYRPLGASGSKKVSDIFINKKIPREQRTVLPVFADNEGIAWVPCLPPAQRLRLDGTECLALRLTYRRDTLPL